MLEMFGKILPRPWPRQPMQLQRLCVPVQFFQLWTIFLAVVRHTLPAIHCLMTAKSQNLYQAVLENISVNIPLFSLPQQCQTGNHHQEMHFEMFILK